MTQAVSYLQYKIRPGQRADARAAFLIFHTALQEHGFWFPRENVGAGPHFVDFGAQNDPDRDDLVAVSGGKVCGFLVLVKRTSGCGEIAKMFVAPSHRRRGVGAALHERCLQRARARGYRKLVLVTEVQFASARRFYERAGWVRAPDLPIPGHDQRHYSFDLTRQG